MIFFFVEIKVRRFEIRRIFKRKSSLIFLTRSLFFLKSIERREFFVITYDFFGDFSAAIV